MRAPRMAMAMVVLARPSHPIPSTNQHTTRPTTQQGQARRPGGVGPDGGPHGRGLRDGRGCEPPLPHPRQPLPGSCAGVSSCVPRNGAHTAARAPHPTHDHQSHAATTTARLDCSSTHHPTTAFIRHQPQQKHPHPNTDCGHVARRGRRLRGGRLAGLHLPALAPQRVGDGCEGLSVCVCVGFDWRVVRGRMHRWMDGPSQSQSHHQHPNPHNKIQTATAT